MDVNKTHKLWSLDTNNLPLTVELLEKLSQCKDTMLVDKVILSLSDNMLKEPTVLVKIIELHIKLGNNNLAFDYAERLTVLTNNHSLALHYLILTSFLLYKHEDVIQLSNQHTLLPESYLFVARAEYLLGNIAVGINLIEKHNLVSDEALGVLSIMKLDAGLFEQAFELCDKALSNTPNQFEALLTKTTQYCMEQHYNHASECIDVLLKFQPKNGRVLSLKGQVYFYQIDFPKAIHTLSLSTEYMPEHIGTWHLLAWAYFLSDNFQDALHAFEQSLLLDRNFGESHGGIACVYAALLREDEARKSSKLALKLNKLSFAGRYAQAILLQNKGNEKEASQLIKDITSADSGYKNTSFSEQIAKALQKRN